MQNGCSKNRLLISLLFSIYTISIVAISSCSVSGQAIATLSKPVPETATPVSTSTPPPTLTPAPTPTVTPTPNLSGAIVQSQDLPFGFEAVSAADLGKFNFSEASIAGSFKQFSTEAHPRNLFVFAKNNPKLELVVGFVLYPLSPTERVAIDSSLSNPDSVLQMVAAGFAMGGRTIKSSRVIPGLDRFGDRSVGVTVIPTIESQQLRMDAVVTRRGSVVQVVCLIYTDGSLPSLEVGVVAQILDSRVTTALGK